MGIDRSFPFIRTSEPFANLLVADLSTPNSFTNLISVDHISHVIHLAANSDIKASSLNPELELRDTYLTTLNLVEAMNLRSSPLQSFVFASSSAVFGITEGKIGSSTPRRPVSPYGWMKLASEAVLENAATKLAATVSVYRFPNVVGPFSTHGVIFDLCKKILQSPIELEVLGDGNQTKPYIHVEELVSIIHKRDVTGISPRGFNVVNIGPDSLVTVRFIAEAIRELSGINVPIRFGETPWGWPGDVPTYCFETNHSEYAQVEISSSEGAVKAAISEVLIQLQSGDA